MVWDDEHSHTLVKLILDRGYVDVVEVGVACGGTSRRLLEISSLHLTLVDNWLGLPTRRRWNQDIADRAKLEALRSTDFAKERRRVCHGNSKEIAEKLRKESMTFDLIFIDACHRYRSVVEDCESWWPMVRAGGILCGHDLDNYKYRVREAVTEFCDRYGLSFYSLSGDVWAIDKA